ncbi:uncharacterized protein LOC123535118 isoform X2 [Mercenaria mercenaria]|uniref:uncharacterized protein LOC123535118 isoform X2 n=1 Tax=Mercenaria mercenaria TaxID=6596 RepID=UPI00234E6FBE|nr:uncharacterized protein LOC123535118 isoform X2 [Mercenaria mercenaria]
MEDYYTIQTPGHHSTMFAELHVLQKQGVMCDVILAAEDGEVMAHKVVLMAASKYFRDKLSPVMGPTASKICLKGISVVELANLVKYIYTGKLLVAKETMDITLEISEILELQGVIQGYKEIISYEQMKDNPGNAAALKSEPLSLPAAVPPGISSKSFGETSAIQSTNVHLPKTSDQATIGQGQPAVSNVLKISSTYSGTQSVASDGTTVTSTSMVPEPDSNQSSKVVVTEQCEDGTSVTYHLDNNGDAADVNISQSTSNDFNFDALYDQQYMDVSAGSRTPAKNPGVNSPQNNVTPPKLQQMAPLPTDSQKIAEERAQHQDLLAVAIETLSDVPHLKHHPHQTQPEIDRAISSISGSEPTQIIPQNMTGLKPEDDLEDFENGKTNTKTVTMSAGSVNNELGGKTDVYTVALDPASVKTPLKMARPKRTKTAKEKEAEEKAKKYRQKKAELIAGVTKDLKLGSVNYIEPRRGKRQKTSALKQDFQYESLSKTKKKNFSPRILLIPKNSENDHISGIDKKDEAYGENTKVTPKVVKVPKEEKVGTSGDDFGQVVNFDSESEDEDDVDGMIVNDMVSAFNDGECESKETKNWKGNVDKTKADTSKVDLSEPKQSRIEKDKVNTEKGKELETSNKKEIELSDKEENNKKERNLKTKSINNVSDVEKNMGIKEDEEKANQVPNENEEAERILSDKKNEREEFAEDVNDEKELLDDLHVQNIDEATAEKMRSSATKRKTRTPRKLPLSDEEKGNDSGSDRHDNIPVVRTRRSSRSLNLDKEKEQKTVKTDTEKNVGSEAKNKKRSKTNLDEADIKCNDKDLPKTGSSCMRSEKEKENKSDKTETCSERDFSDDNVATNKKKPTSDFDGVNIDCRDKDVSKPTEIKIIAQCKVDEKALGEAEKQIHDSESKKIIIVPKNYQPEIRLKKRTTEEMLQLAKEIPVSQGKVPSEIELEMEAYETGEGDDDDDYGDISADDGNKDPVENANGENKNKEKKTIEVAGKRKNEESVKSPAGKKRKIASKVSSSSQINESGEDHSENETLDDSPATNSIGKRNIFDIMKDKDKSPTKTVGPGKSAGSSNRKTGSSSILETERKGTEKNIEIDKKKGGKAISEKEKGANSKPDDETNEKGDSSKTDYIVKAEKEKEGISETSIGVKAIKRKSGACGVKASKEKGDSGKTDVKVKSVKGKEKGNSAKSVVGEAFEMREEATSTEYAAEDEESDWTDDETEELGDSMVYVCSEDNCLFSSKSLNSLRRHQSMFHDFPITDAVEQTESSLDGETSAQSDKKKLNCGHCDFETPFKSSMTTHLKLKHSLKKAMFMCKYCSYGTPLTGNLRKHLYSSHGLIIITKQHRKSPEYEQFEEGTIVTKDGQIFDPETMELPKAPKKKSVKVKQEIDDNDTPEGNINTEGKKRARISLCKLPVDDFLKEMMKRHEQYLNKPEPKYSFMSFSLAKATEYPSFPQASPQVRNTRANKIYNMKKLKPTFTDQHAEQNAGTYGIGNLHGMYQAGASVPQVASEVEVELDNQPEVVVENVEGDASTTVLTISEQKGMDGSEMIIINQNGKQTVVRSKDFYDTLKATGHDTNQTLGVISALLQAGEQIEIREQEEVVEIQNI